MISADLRHLEDLILRHLGREVRARGGQPHQVRVVVRRDSILGDPTLVVGVKAPELPGGQRFAMQTLTLDSLETSVNLNRVLEALRLALSQLFPLRVPFRIGTRSPRRLQIARES